MDKTKRLYIKDIALFAVGIGLAYGGYYFASTATGLTNYASYAAILTGIGMIAYSFVMDYEVGSLLVEE